MRRLARDLTAREELPDEIFFDGFHNTRSTPGLSFYFILFFVCVCVAETRPFQLWNQVRGPQTFRPKLFPTRSWPSPTRTKQFKMFPAEVSRVRVSQKNKRSHGRWETRIKSVSLVHGSALAPRCLSPSEASSLARLPAAAARGSEQKTSKHKIHGNHRRFFLVLRDWNMVVQCCTASEATHQFALSVRRLLLFPETSLLRGGIVKL